MPDEKQILNVANQAAAENNIGDYVEVNGKSHAPVPGQRIYWATERRFSFQADV